MSFVGFLIDGYRLSKLDNIRKDDLFFLNLNRVYGKAPTYTGHLYRILYNGPFVNLYAEAIQLSLKN